VEDNRDGATTTEAGTAEWKARRTIPRRQAANATGEELPHRDDVVRGDAHDAHGDEVRRTQGGNNNAYCQDNETSWFDWTLLAKRADVHRFVTMLNALRILRTSSMSAASATETS